MVWPEDIASELPEPHPEEPASLRSDILDELYDHLLSSLEHEQLTEADQETARKSVLARFGNPATIACRLWWDAMWERIMLQRITLVFVALLCCCAIVATFLIWKTVVNSQLATAALMAQVQKLAERESVPAEPVDDRFKYLEWLPVTVRLQDEAGKPVNDEEYTVHIVGQNMSGNGGMDTYSGQPDEYGVVDFGLIKPGMRNISINKTGLAYSRDRTYSFRPGKPVELEITCPRELLHWDEKTLEIQWPDDLKDRDLWVYLRLTTEGRIVDGLKWTADQVGTPSSVSVLLDPPGRCYETELFADAELETPLANIVDGYLIFEVLWLATTGERRGDLKNGYRPDITASQLLEESLLHWWKPMKVVLEHKVYADASEFQDTIPLVQSGMTIESFAILKRQAVEAGTDNAVFINVVPSQLLHDKGGEKFEGFEFTADASAPSSWEADRWVYRPTDDLVELVRKRLEQIDEAEKPGEAGKTEAVKP